MENKIIIKTPFGEVEKIERERMCGQYRPSMHIETVYMLDGVEYDGIYALLCAALEACATSEDCERLQTAFYKAENKRLFENAQYQKLVEHIKGSFKLPKSYRNSDNSFDAVKIVNDEIIVSYYNCDTGTSSTSRGREGFDDALKLFQAIGRENAENVQIKKITEITEIEKAEFVELIDSTLKTKKLIKWNVLDEDGLKDRRDDGEFPLYIKKINNKYVNLLLKLLIKNKINNFVLIPIVKTGEFWLATLANEDDNFGEKYKIIKMLKSF